MYAAYVLLLVLGLRRGEMLGLAWDDVDLEHGVALIAWQVQRVEGQLLRRRTKTPSSDAPLPLPDIAVRALERHRLEEARRRLAAGAMWGDCGLVFTTRLGDPIDPRNFHTGRSRRALRGRGCLSSQFTPPDAPAPRCSWRSMCTLGSPWRYCGTAVSP